VFEQPAPRLRVDEKKIIDVEPGDVKQLTASEDESTES